MDNNLQFLNIEEEADFKFGKLCEIAQDIEKNGQDGDQFARQAVFIGIAASDNEILNKKLEEALLDNNSPEMLKTIITGLFLNKGNFEILPKYINILFAESKIIDESFENKESILLLADALIDAVKNNETKEEYTHSLFKLYKASCSPDSTAILADTLLQRFMNILHNKCKVIDDNLLEIIRDKNSEINARLISIDILGRSKPIETYPHIEEIILNLDDFALTYKEKLYLLDVITKLVYGIASSNPGIDYSKALNELNSIEIKKISEEAKMESKNTDSENFDTLTERIRKRIKHLNEIANSNN